MMDPIERIANRLVADCTKSLECLCEIERIIDSSETIVAALEQLRQRDFKRFVDEEHLDWIPYDIGRYRRCIEAIGDIKRMARKVFAVNFFDADVYLRLQPGDQLLVRVQDAVAGRAAAAALFQPPHGHGGDERRDPARLQHPVL
jgi:hypothetical protein